MKIYLKKHFYVYAVVLLFSACTWSPRRKHGQSNVVEVAFEESMPQNSSGQKKKIMILSSTGGGGHTSASAALVSYLSKDYEVEVVQIFRDVLGDFDPLNYWSSGRFCGEDLYNFFLTEGMLWGGSLCCTIGKRSWVSWHRNKMRERLESFFIHTKPDLVISVVPVINGLMYDVVKKLHMRGILLTLDPDATHFMCGLQNPDYEHFHCAIPCDDTAILAAISGAKIPQEKLRVVGFPVRESFLTLRDRTVVRDELGIPQDRMVIMVLMGAAGGRSAIGYARKLAQIDVPLHIIFCVGRNEGLRNKICSLKFPQHITFSCFGFTDRIADLMQASDLLITKSGAASMFEALYAQVPMLLDHTSHLISWEHTTVEFVCRHGFGEEVTSLHLLPIMIKKYINKPYLLEDIRAKMREYNILNPRDNIRKLVADVLVDITDKESYECIK